VTPDRFEDKSKAKSLNMVTVSTFSAIRRETINEIRIRTRSVASKYK